MIRLVLPYHLRRLAEIQGEAIVQIEGPVTQRTVFDALEAQYPMLCGTIRDQQTKQRRPYIRFFACQQDLSQQDPDQRLPDAVVSGAEPLLVIGALAGG